MGDDVPPDSILGPLRRGLRLPEPPDVDWDTLFDPGPEPPAFEFGPPKDGPPPSKPVKPRSRRKRSGKSYDAGVVAAIVCLAAGLNERPRRAVRERWFNEGAVAGATTSLMDHILDLVGDEPLPPARRRQWRREARLMVDEGSVTREELTQRLA